ncbi:MAG: hypothetical protein EXS36_07610, partial [Pedosphaera sp.]|nr:hypothetical protein [Pedosphaera sp.]
MTKQPTAQSAAHNSLTTFSLSAPSSAVPLVIQWQKNGVSLPGVTGASVTFGPLTPTDNGAKYRALISLPGAYVTSDEVALTVTPDVTPPTVISAVSSS